MCAPGAAHTAVAISRIFNCLSGRFPHQSADRFGMTAIGGTFLTRIVPSFHSAGGFVLSGLTKIGKGSIIRKKHLSASGAGWARGENRESGEKPERYRHCKRKDPAQGENRSLGVFSPRRPGRIVRRASQETCSNG